MVPPPRQDCCVCLLIIPVSPFFPLLVCQSGKERDAEKVTFPWDLSSFVLLSAFVDAEGAGLTAVWSSFVVYMKNSIALAWLMCCLYRCSDLSLHMQSTFHLFSVLYLLGSDNPSCGVCSLVNSWTLVCRWSVEAGSPSTSASWREDPRTTGLSWLQSLSPGIKMKRWGSLQDSGKIYGKSATGFYLH